MRAFLALIGKHVHESTWSLVLLSAALFGWGWLWVYVTSLNEAEILRLLASDEGGGRMEMMRNMGLGDVPSSASIMMTFWSHPIVFLLISFWAIGRGSAAVGAEVERGTMDLILSRPVARWVYLTSHVLVATIGLVILSLALLIGASIAVRYNILREPPTPGTFLPPAVNLGALGLPIYGYTLFFSSIDHVRWRPMSVGSVLTLAGVIFKAYNPVELVTKGETLGTNLAILGGIGISCIVVSFIAFAVRDLPANG
jgi:ABC-2 type transport system permease protein